MQTFIPLPDFRASVEVLDRQRLQKQRVETFQVLGGLLRVKLVSRDQIGTRWSKRRKVHNGLRVTVEEEVPVYRERPQDEWELIPRVTENGRTWGDHVIGQMWAGHEYSLLEYQRITCEVWTQRGGKNDTCYPKSKFLVEHVLEKTAENSALPSWWGRDDVHSSHRANLLRKGLEDAAKGRVDVYADLGWTETPIDGYVWPA